MPRSPDGSYSLPLPDVAPGEVISSTWANTTMNDIAATLQASLDRNGNGGMNVPLLFQDGAVGSPGVAWVNESNTGFYRAALADMRVSVLGQDTMRWRGSGNFPQIWNVGQTRWETILTDGASGNVTVPPGNSNLQILEWSTTSSEWELGAALEKVPPGTVDGQRLSWDAGGGTWGLAPPPSGGDLPLGTEDGQLLRWEQSGSIWETSSVLKISDSGTVLATGSINVGQNVIVGGTVDGRDVAADGTAQDSHIGNDGIHFTEASINHQSISGSGVRTHAQLDNHYDDSTIHFTVGSISHTAIQNIGSNSHADIDDHISTGNIHFADTGSATPQIRTSSGWDNGVRTTSVGTALSQATALQVMSQSDYDSLGSKDSRTLYFVTP